MKKVKGFDKARRLLARENYWESFTVSPALTAQIKQIFGEELSVHGVVDRIIDDVRNKGDKALLDYTEKLDGVRLDSVEVDRQEIAVAYDITDKELVSALKFAAKRIRDFHIACRHKTGLVSIDKYLKQQILPLQKVGLYVPGGAAIYPSSVLMMAIPAKVAGVEEIVVVSPPAKDGSIPGPTLIAADIAGVDHIYKIGGAQAIAALAFGTQSIPKVYKICGPGNIFVTTAKKVVYGTVAIDGLEGPSEAMILADEKADPVLCAADLLAQAEHDALASVVLVTTSANLVDRVEKEIDIQMGKLKRLSIVGTAIETGMIVLIDDMAQAVELVNIFAPEHLSLMTSNASTLIPKIHNAGCVFMGKNSPVVLGDYVAGPSHVLPTGGSAHFGSPLGVVDFLKVNNIIAFDESTMKELSQPAVLIAKAEGLDAHAKAVALRVVASEAKQSRKSLSSVKKSDKGKDFK